MSDSRVGMRWYIVHTMSNYEKKAGEAIKLEIERALQLKENNVNRAIENNKSKEDITHLRNMKKEFASRFGEVKVSLQETAAAKKGGKTRTISKYPGYIFMRLDLDHNEESPLKEIFQKQKISELKEVSYIPFLRKFLIVLSLTRTPFTIAMIMVWSMCFILLPKYTSIHNGFRRSISKDSMNSSKQIWKKPVRIKIKVNH